MCGNSCFNSQLELPKILTHRAVYANDNFFSKRIKANSSFKCINNNFLPTPDLFTADIIKKIIEKNLPETKYFYTNYKKYTNLI